MRCFYCKQPEDDAHRYGCPGELEPASVRSIQPKIEGAEDAYKPFDEAVREFERGNEDGHKAPELQTPSEHPSYRLGLALASEARGIKEAAA